MDAQAFGLSSLQGTYAVRGAGWGGQAPLAAIGLLAFGGDGTVSGRTLQSLPGDRFGERRLLESPVEATCTVAANGTGSIVPAGGGDTLAQFAITRVAAAGGAWIAQDVSLVFRALEPVTGSLVTGRATRLPDEGAFTDASLSGTYVGTSVGRGGQTPGAGFGVLIYDGAGRFSETNITNVQAGSFRDRTFVTGADQGVYAVNADGTGTVANGGVVFVITRAEVVGGIRRALEYAFIVRDLVPATGSHVTGITRRRSD